MIDDSAKHQPYASEFALGDVVRVKSALYERGAVIAILPGEQENRFAVLVNGERRNYYASQLLKDAPQTHNTETLNSERFHCHLTALQIRHPSLSTLYSLNAARVDFIPYQFRPVLKFIRSDRPRLLIADAVGVGKTIEAGLILRELQARNDVQSILIVCPRPLVAERKWQNEMKRFDEQFDHLDGPLLRYCVDEMDMSGEWPAKYRRVIVPYSLFDEALLFGSQAERGRKLRKGLLDLRPPPRFDLVIVDEAHHIRNPETFQHKAVRFFCENAENVVFLTATPIQLGNHDLFVLLSILRPDLIIDRESFEHMAEPNPHINQAVSLVRAQQPQWSIHAAERLSQASATPWGQSILAQNPDFNRIHSMLKTGTVSAENRVQIIKEIEALHTFAGIINRTRRRDIGDFTIRKPQTVLVEFTPGQRQFHDELLRVQAQIFNRLHDDVNIKFMMTTIRRQAASCLYGLVPQLEEILTRHFDELSWAEADDASVVINSDCVGPIEAQVKALLEHARLLDPQDPKLEALRTTIRDKQRLNNNKVMLFSSFRHTLGYLHQHLRADGFRVGLVHGGTPDDERAALRQRFELPRENAQALDVLLFSEVGCEGLDYQFCDCIVNYDLPWNPMRIEQRIGRIDRNGQKSESVAIVNFITPGTVDADIYDRCLMRIGIFNNALGGGEEILGEISQEIRNIAENYLLSDTERQSRLQQLADNQIRLIQEQEQLEQRQMELFGVDLPAARMRKEIEDASSCWLAPKAILRLVTHYLRRISGKEQDVILGDKPLKTLRLSQDARNCVLRDFQRLERQNSSTWRQWENWLKGSDPHLAITFESAGAMEHPQAAFIMPLHPLVKQAAQLFDTAQYISTTLSVRSDAVAAGRYPFAIYQWQFHGIRNDMILQPIAESEMLAAHLGRLLETATDAASDDTGNIDAAAQQRLDNQHDRLWSEARQKHRQRTRDLAAYRRESLSTSHRSRIALLNGQLKIASNDKIQKMRRSQLAAAEADFNRRVSDLERATGRADIIAGPVAYGVLVITGDLVNGK
ncbi:MAG: DEAD/DEAH box helicase [Phycisphaerales bacterium]|nr:DEAD/DEAH box helicase [Phycisphaerales bacterium]